MSFDRPGPRGRGAFLSMALLGLALATGLTACGDYLNGKKKEAQVIELSDERLKCLDQMPVLLRDFSVGDAKEDQIRANLGCMREAFQYFRERTVGSLPEAYTAADLRKFFRKYFVKQTEITPQFSEGFMRLKKALIGGSDRYITKPELDRIVDILRVVEDETVKMAPHMKVLLGDKKSAPGPERLQESVEQVRKTLKILLNQVELSRSDYSFADLQEMFTALSQFVEEATGPRPAPAPVSRLALKNNGGIDQIRSWLPLLKTVKVVFFGERANLQGQREWYDAINTVVDLYDLVLRYHYFLQGSRYDTPRDLKIALDFADRILRLLETSHQINRTGRLPFTALDQLIDEVYARKIVDLPASAEVLKPMYRRIVLGMLDPVRRGDSRGADAIERVHLLSLRREFNIFRLNQFFADWSFSAGARQLDPESRLRVARQFPAADVAKRLTADPGEAEALVAAWAKFKDLLLKSRPVAFNEKGRISILTNTKDLRWTWHGLTRFNVMHFLVRGFMLGYGDHRDPVLAHCSEKDMIRWYADFQDFGIAIRAFDPRSGNSGARSFKEASFFTFSGNGDDRISMDEMFEFVSMLVSGGLNTVNSVTASLHDLSCEVAQRDIFDLPMLNEACFKRELRGHFGDDFDNLPGLVKYVSRLNDQEWNSFYNDWISTARTSSPDSGLIETADLRTGVMILHYVEALFTIYDTDRDERLSVAEVEAAAPRFMNLLRQVSGLNNRTLVTQGFVALVFKGQKPDAVGLGDNMLDRFRQWLTGSPKYADRGHLVRVFSNLKDELANPSSKANP
ncbi:MAG: hypothetical protein KF802_03285 [Bdellovibrionaceae bacterium]|nr:hypothetical protein [Pseudobdellovibrionaceae bacterium]